MSSDTQRGCSIPGRYKAGSKRGRIAGRQARCMRHWLADSTMQQIASRHCTNPLASTAASLHTWRVRHFVCNYDRSLDRWSCKRQQERRRVFRWATDKLPAGHTQLNPRWKGIQRNPSSKIHSRMRTHLQVQCKSARQPPRNSNCKRAVSTRLAAQAPT